MNFDVVRQIIFLGMRIGGDDQSFVYSAYPTTLHGHAWLKIGTTSYEYSISDSQYYTIDNTD